LVPGGAASYSPGSTSTACAGRGPAVINNAPNAAATAVSLNFRNPMFDSSLLMNKSERLISLLLLGEKHACFYCYGDNLHLVAAM
jgi:hypothetical protein